MARARRVRALSRGAPDEPLSNLRAHLDKQAEARARGFVEPGLPTPIGTHPSERARRSSSGVPKIDDLVRAHGARCYICGAQAVRVVTSRRCGRGRRWAVPGRGWLEREHVVPKSAGGVGGDNIKLACTTCNLAKGSLPLRAFLDARDAPTPQL